MPPRRVKKPKIKPSPCASSSSGEASSQANPPDNQAVPPSWPVVRFGRGSLQNVPDLAIELQLQIFGQLHPRDLFNLSRTCKKFRSFFLHRSNERLWTAALKNAEDLPTPPPWMSIPGFIHLLYSPYCHNCGAGNVRKVLWPWFVRYCGKCISELACGLSEAYEKVKKMGYMNTWHFSSVCDKLFNIVDQRLNHFENKQYNKFLLQDVEDVLEEWSALEKRKVADPLQVLKSQRSREIKTRRAYAKKCAAWFSEMEKDRAAVLKDKRKERFEHIVSRLRETGWEKEIEYLGQEGLERMSGFPVVRQSAKLTNKGWEQVQAALGHFLRATRDSRLSMERNEATRFRANELEEAIIACCIQLPRTEEMEYRPRATDIDSEPECLALGMAPTADKITRDHFIKILPPVIARWKEKQKKALTDLLLPCLDIQRLPRGTDPLDLAIAVFCWAAASSDHCRAMRYPEILSQDCLRRYANNPIEKSPGMDAWVFRGTNTDRIPFTLSSFDPRVVKRGVEWMGNIVIAMGLDPQEATFAELSKSRERLRCLECSQHIGDDRVYTWEAAFNHTAQNNLEYWSKAPFRHHEWERVSDKETIAHVRKIEAVKRPPSLGAAQWCCSLCLTWDGRRREVRKHLHLQHGISNMARAMRDGTLFRHPSDRVSKPPISLGECNGANGKTK